MPKLRHHYRTMRNVGIYRYSVYISQRNQTKFGECSIPPQNLMEYPSIQLFGNLAKFQCRNGRRRTIYEDVNSHSVFDKVLFWVVIFILKNVGIYRYSVYIAQRNPTKFGECSIPPQNLMEYP
jgi:L-rhamnose mutarotase